MEQIEKVFNLDQIKKNIPHRDPILMLEKVEILAEGRGLGFKKLEEGHPIFAGHFPGNPILPGVMQVEAMAQLCAVMEGFYRQEEISEYDTPPIMMLVSVSNVRFFQRVTPGMTLCLEAKRMSSRLNITKYSCQLTCDGEKMSVADIVGAHVSP